MTDNRQALLRRLHASGVTLFVDVDRLRYRGPAGAITPAMLTALDEVKSDLVYEYHERAAIMEFDGCMPRAEAEARAAVILTGGAT